MQVSLSQIKDVSLLMVGRRLWNWWLKELLNLLPERAAEWLSDHGRAKLFLTPTERGSILDLRSSRDVLISSDSVDRNTLTLEAIDQFMRAHEVDPKDTDVGLLLPESLIFSRQLYLPLEAAGAVDAIVSQDLARKTPFKPHDVYSDYATVPGNPKAKIVVHQWIVQRQFVEEALSDLDIDLARIAFVAARATGPNGPAPYIKLAGGGDAPNRWLRRMTLAFSCSAVLLAIVAGSLKYWTQQVEMDRLATEIAIKNKMAQQVRLLIDQSQSRKSALLHFRLQRRETPGLLDVWEEVTRILPGHTWLTELRVAEVGAKHEDQITLSGFSGAAPSVVSTIDSSPLFFDAALTSPIAFDPGESRERFSMQAKVRAAP